MRLRIFGVVLALAGFGAWATPALAADGAGTMTVSPSTVIAGSTGNYVRFTYTADAAGLNGGSLALIVPSGWTTPSTSGGEAGGVGGTCGAAEGYTVTPVLGGSEVQTTGVTLGGNQQCTIQYGIDGSGPGDTAPSAPGASTFNAEEGSGSASTLAALAVSPQVQVSADGTGRMTVSPASAIAGSTGNTWTFTYTASTTIVSGELTIAVPGGFSVPSATASALGATTTSCHSGSVSVSGSTIQISGFTLLTAATCTVTYGDTSQGGPGATATAAGGYTADQFAAEERSSSTGTLTALASGSPLMLVTAADGSGTMGVSPASTVTGSTGNYLTFTFFGPEGGIDDGSLAIVVPKGWTTPNADDTQPGGLGGSCGAAAGYTVTPVSGGEEVQTGNVYMFGGQQCTIKYGVSGDDSGVTAPTTGGSYTFEAREASTPDGTLTGLASSPSIDVGSGGAGTMTVTPATALSSSAGNTLTFTYTASVPLSDGTLAIAVPAGWSTPSSARSAAGATTTDCPDGTVSVSGSTIDVSGVDLLSGSCTITYGDTSAGPGASAPASGGGGEPYTFTAQEQSSSSDTLTRLSSGSPQVTVVAADGSGSIDVSPGAATPSSTGNELTFTYTAPTGGLDGGGLSIAVPPGWSPPQTGSASTPGYVTTSCGSATVTSSTIDASGVTLDDGAQCTVTYGSGTGASAPSTAAPTTFTTDEYSSAGGTPTPLATQPVVNVSEDGSGSVGVSPQTASASATANTLTFTYDAAAPLNAGEVAITVPFGWSLPSTMPSAPGYTTTTCSGASLAIITNVITLTDVTLGGSGDCTVTYGDTSQGGAGATASSTPGTAAFLAQEMSSASGTLTALPSSPAVNVYALDGTGRLTAARQYAASGSTGNTLAFTYTAAAGGLNGGQIDLAVPPEWPAPSTSAADGGYTTSDCGTAGVSGQTIEVTGVTLSGGSTCTITYGDESGGGPGATAPTPPGRYAFSAQDASSKQGITTAIPTSPAIDIPSADGVGTVSAGPASVTAGSSHDSLSFSYVAAAGGIDGGRLMVTVPAGWTPPSTSATAAGAVTASCGTVAVSGMSIGLTGVSVGGGDGCTIVYGSKSGGGPGVRAPSTAGTATFATSEMSTADGALTPLRSYPSVDVMAAGGHAPTKPGQPSITCVVPKLKGDSLPKAKRLLHAAHCAVGKVSKPKARKHHRLGKLVVSASTPRGAAKLAAGSKVGLKLGPAPKHRRRHHPRGD